MYNEDESDEWFLPVSGAKDNRQAKIRKGIIMVSYQDMQRCFDPVVGAVIEVINQQISAVKSRSNNVKALVLVGGFGESRYLQHRIREAIKPVQLLLPGDK
jgi:hypothetical protein